MIGTYVNVAAIAAGSLVGMLLKRGIPERVNKAILKAEGIAIFIIGLNGVLTTMLFVGAGGRLEADGAVLLLVSLLIGCLIGEGFNIEDRLTGLGESFERKFKANNLSQGFVTASLIFVVGAMAIVGSLNDGLSGDSTVLFMKALLDGITSIVLAASLGAGVIFSAIPVFAYQGTITMLARLIAPYISDEPIRLISMVGYAIVMAIGVNFIAETKIRVANLLPALIVPVLYYYIFVFSA